MRASTDDGMGSAVKTGHGRHPGDIGQCLEAEPVFAHHRGQGQRGGYFREFCRLQAETAYLYPTLGSVAADTHNQRGHQQQNHASVCDPGGALPEIGRNYPDYEKGRYQRNANPYEVHSVFLVKVKYVGTLPVQHREYIDPAKEYQREPAPNQGPVQFAIWILVPVHYLFLFLTGTLFSR